jgi:hypothetical protein
MLCSQQNCYKSSIARSIGNSRTSSFPPLNSVSHCQNPHSNGTFTTVDDPILIHHYHLKCIHYVRAHSCIVHSVGIKKYVIISIHHYRITQTRFTTLKILCVLLICSSPLPASGNLWIFFPVSIVQPFPKCLMISITQYVTFSDWVLLHSNMHLRFLHIFSWFDTSFLFSANSITLSEYDTVYLFIHPMKDILLASLLW